MGNRLGLAMVRVRWVVSLIGVAAAMSAAVAGDRGFPFEREMMLEAAPMPGPKRIPILEIDADGAATIDLWCVSLRGQATVGDISFGIVPSLDAAPGNVPQIDSDLDRKNRDAELLAALTQVTGWRKSGDVVELSGPTPLRFRLMTN